MAQSDSLKEAAQLYDQGVLLTQNKLFEEAIEKLEAARKICEKLGNLEGLGNIEREIGVALFCSGRPMEAMPHYHLAIQFFEKLFLNCISFGSGKSNYQKIAMARIMDKISTIYMKEGFALRDSGMSNEAIAHFEYARDWWERLQNAEQAASMEMNIGQELLVQGREKEALVHFNLAKPVFQNLGASKQDMVGAASLKIGMAFRNLNQYDEALVNFRDAESIYANLRRCDDLTGIDIHIGDTFSIIGEYKAAMHYYDKARKILSSLPVSNKTAELNAGLALGIANTLQSMKQYDKALKQYKLAKAFLKNRGSLRQDLIAEIDMDTANTLSLMGKPAEALQFYNGARTIFVKLGEQQRIAEIDSNMGNNFNELKQHSKAIQKYENAIKICADFGFIQTQSDACAGLAQSYLDKGDPKSGLGYLITAIKLMEWVRAGVRSPELQRKLRERYFERFDALGDTHLGILEKGGNPRNLDAAFNAFELSKCATLAESMEMAGARVSCPNMEKLMIEEDRLVNIAAQKYSKLQQLMKLRGSIDADSAKFRRAYGEWEKEYDENYKEVEKLRYEALLHCADIGSTPLPRDYKVLERAIDVFPKDGKWCVLEYVFSSSTDRWIVFLIDQTGLVQFEILPSGDSEISRLALLCRDIIKSVRNSSHEVEKSDKKLNSLSETLLPILVPEKTLTILENKAFEHLMVIPHGVLHWVPFEILSDESTPLGLKYAMSTNFSLDVARICIEKRAKREKKLIEHPLFLIVQNPLVDLAGADKESLLLKNLIRAGKIDYELLLREKATESAFIETANALPFEVLHHAGHALFMGKDPSLSSLYLHTDQNCQAEACGGKNKTHKPDLLNATEIINRIKFKGTPLVYLSACETGISGVEPGEESFGLVRALMFAGATSLITSRWEVNDKIGPIFAKAFYSHLLKGETAGIALRNARKKVFKKAPSNFTDWGAFSLCGDPFRTIT